LLAFVFVAALGGVGWYAWQSGMIGDAPLDDTSASEGITTGIPEPDMTTRSGFLAAFDTGPCSFTTRISSGSNAGMIEGYSSTGETFGGLPVAYEEQFGARPAILSREITQAQCAALSFVRKLQGRGRAPIVSTLSTDTATGNTAISAQIRTSGDAAVWAVLITPDGGVFDLTPNLSDPVGGLRTLGFRLQPSATEAPHLILTVSSETPLVRAANAQNGTSADVLLPAVLEEIADRGGAASASLSYLLLTP
jgi:serine/threonine-protein kinase